MIIFDLVSWPEDVSQDQREEMSETMSMSMIISHLSHKIIGVIDKEDTLAKLWKKFEKMF